MRLAILETGRPDPEVEVRFGRYPAMFEALLGSDAVEAIYDVTQGAFPEEPDAHGAYLITGSSAGVYDDLPWIDPLKQFLRDAGGETKLVGICFGHQIMAEAFGGKVVKSDKGWGIGLHHYAMADGINWIERGGEIAVPVCHQDQVIVQPPASTIIGGNAFCPIGALAYADRPAISFQFHPEFEPAVFDQLIALIGDEIADPAAASASLAEPNDRMRIGGWIKRFVAE